jgi:hypothetical protein
LSVVSSVLLMSVLHQATLVSAHMSSQLPASRWGRQRPSQQRDGVFACFSARWCTHCTADGCACSQTGLLVPAKSQYQWQLPTFGCH